MLLNERVCGLRKIVVVVNEWQMAYEMNDSRKNMYVCVSDTMREPENS